MKVSLIIPAKNEKESLGKVLTELKQYSIVNDIIIIVDSKKDNSIKIAKKFNTKIIVQKKIFNVFYVRKKIYRYIKMQSIYKTQKIYIYNNVYIINPKATLVLLNSDISS